MATADELLATSDVLWINVDARQIEIPPNVKVLGVESDHKSQKLKFAMPRYYNDIDYGSSEYMPYINYENAKGSRAAYVPVDKGVTDDTVTFTWIVGRTVVEYPGTVKFSVDLKDIGYEGGVDGEFNTTWASLPVLESITAGTYEAPKEQRDDYASIAYLAIQKALDTNLKGDPGYTPVKGVDYYTPSEKEELVEEVVQNHNGIVANSFTGTASGAVIRVDDVNPVEHTVKAKVGGKNLFDISKLSTTSIREDEYATRGYISSVTENNMTITTPSTHTSNGYAICGKTLGDLCPGLIAGQKFVMSATTNSINKFIYLSAPSALTIAFNTSYIATDNMLASPVIFYGLSASATVSQGTGDCVISNIQVELGDAVTEYEPYVDPTTIRVFACGSNILDSSKLATQTPGVFSNVALLSSNDDGTSITIRGNDGASANANSSGWLVLTPQPNSSYPLVFLKAGDTVTVSADTTLVETGIWDNTFKFAMINNTTGKTLSSSKLTLGNKTRHSATFTAVTDGMHRVLIMVNGNTMTLENIMISINREVTEFEPYEGTTYTPSADGTCDIVSVSPTMTIFTDTAGVIVECEYGRDSNKVLEGIGGGSPGIPVDIPFDNVLLRDKVDGKTYSIYVSNGSLKMEVVE